MSPDLLLALLFIGILLALYIIGVPVAFAMGLTCLLLMFSPLISFEPQLIMHQMVTSLDNFIILAVPLFLMTGLYMNMFGMTTSIFDFSEALVGSIRGGIAHVNVVASVIFSGMSGAAQADAAGLGVIEFNAMKERGYDEGYSVAVTGSSSIIGPIIPPSIPVIFYGIMAEESIGALFIAGVVPGLILASVLLLMCTYYAHKKGFERGESWSINRILETFKRAAPALGAPILIIGGIMLGLFTATEAGAVALFYTLLIGFVFYDSPSLKEFLQVSYEGFVTTAALLFIITAAFLYSFMVRRAQIPHVLSDFVTGITTNPLPTLLLLVAILLIIGLMMETIAAITILVPVLLPIIHSAGIDPIHFGIIMILTLMIGLLTPPFGIILFILQKVTGVPLSEIMRSILPFYFPLVGVLILLILFPEITLSLPRLSGLV
ncbi:TRAP transporter large permease [Natrialba swarupiae]|uniref:TRAP transporter large permease n=1 Tax=Natrialba swarupiae TaxID=2448032 RepID=A0A5D5ANW0_9EURY|nr:TRAP transporter large permease [Natrialba swarupiae]TYT62607.1 TRAP transporter large permease [Natrialba swarupiae]